MAQVESIKRRVLDRLWTRPGTSFAAFGGQHLLRYAVQKPSRRKTVIDKKNVAQYLSEEPAYTQHAPVRKKFPKPFYNLTELYHLVEVDLIEVGRIAEFNKNVRYLLIAIECTSRKIFLVPMLNKEGQTATRAFRQLLEKEFDQTPHVTRSDYGSEFKDAGFQQLLRDWNIRHVFTNNTEKAAMVERAIQTLQRRIHRYLTHNNTLSYMPVLKKLVQSINDSPHASTGIPPSQFKTSDLYASWERYYLAHAQPPRPFKFKIGDRVRASFVRREGLEKSFRGTYTPQVYTIVARRHTKPHSYTLQDVVGNNLDGNFFEEELILANDRSDRRYLVKDVVDRRVNPTTGRKEVQVTWEGWPKTHRTWIAAKDYDG